MKLNQSVAEKLSIEDGKDERIVHDDAIPRFGLRLRKGGSRKWVVHYRLGGRQHRYTIGDARVMHIDEARQRARKILVAIDDGRDPATEKIEQRTALALRFDTALKDYLQVRERDARESTYGEIERYLNNHWKPLHRLALTSVTHAMVAVELRRIVKENGAITADRARSALSTFYGWAIGEGMVPPRDNPVVGTNKAAKQKSRERVLSDTELAAIYRVAADTDYGRIVRLLALTAQRREEIGGLEWCEVTLDGDAPLIALPGMRTKNHLAHDVPLTPAAVDILKPLRRRDRVHVFGNAQDTGFGGWAFGKQRLDEASGVTGWTIHDLRRTAATRMGDLGVQPHVVEAVLNHISGHKRGVAGIYNRSTYAVEKRAALELWAAHVLKIVGE